MPPAAPPGHEIQVGPVIVVSEEGALAGVSALGDVVRIPLGDDTGDSSHVPALRRFPLPVKTNMIVYSHIKITGSMDTHQSPACPVRGCGGFRQSGNCSRTEAWNAAERAKRPVVEVS